MELSNEFVVSAPIEATWAILTDLERIAPCLPGAQLYEVEGDEYRGTVKVKVGPITSQYKGTATFVDLDATNHKAVLRATGRDIRGQGSATAIVTAQLSEDGGMTKVSVVTELDITGKVAQFGGGMLADIGTKLLGQFAERLENDVVSSFNEARSTAAATEIPVASTKSTEPLSEAPTAPGIRQIAPTGNAPVNLGKLAGSSMLKAIPIMGVVVVAIIKIFRRRPRPRSNVDPG